jgi:hypothetical protein
MTLLRFDGVVLVVLFAHLVVIGCNKKLKFDTVKRRTKNGTKTPTAFVTCMTTG